MTTYHIKAPQTLNVAPCLPSSKSISNRVLILNALCTHPKPILNLSACDDTDVVIKALRKKKGIIDVGAAGTAMRFLTAYLAGKQGHFIITGTERMKNRPVALLVDALRTVGAHIEYLEKEGFPPLQIKGQPLTGGEIEMDGSVSSQYISALLMVAPVMTTGLHLHLTGRISSTPYIEMTVQLMRQFGVTVRQTGPSFFVPPQTYTSIDNFTVESDWSAASYWYQAVALCADREATVSLCGLWRDSLQGDAKMVALFDALGVQSTFTATGVTLQKKQRTLDGLFQFDFSSMPDMAQTFVVTCIMLQIPFHFSGLHSLKIKETDRLAALKTEMQKFGYLLEIHNDNTIEWNGERCQTDVIVDKAHLYDHSPACTNENTLPVVNTYEDHRMAMAFAPASLGMETGICIAHPEVVSKSYPSFWIDLKKAKFIVTPVVDSYFCRQPEICDYDRLPPSSRTYIDYYEDEELDQYRGIAADNHTASAIDEFREVLYTLRKQEIRGWLTSLQLRDIHLPDPLKDEVFLLIEELHNKA